MRASMMTIEDRKTLEQKYQTGQSVRKIAEEMGRHFSGIYREIQHGYTGKMDENGRPGYSADIGQKYAYESRLAYREKRRGTA